MKPKNEIILINISGDDKPGVTTALAEVLARYEAFILDIGQADIHHTLSYYLKLTKPNRAIYLKISCSKPMSLM